MNGTKLGQEEVILASIFHGYMTLRLWSRAVSPRHKTWKKHVDVDVSSSNLNCLEMVWTTRSASQASKILPDILAHYNALVAAWGEDNARKVCRVSINVTDPDLYACTLLENEFGSCGIKITYGRLEISKWIQEHTLRMIDCHKRSYSLLAFCGSPKLSNDIHQSKISNDMITAITGHKHHQMEYVSESYGGPPSKSKRIAAGDAAQTRPDDEQQRQSGLNRRSEVRYDSPNNSFSDSKKLNF